MNLQQFIQQTGTKVTVLPADPMEVEAPHVELERGASLRMLWEGGKEGGGAGGQCLYCRLMLALLHEVNAPLAKDISKTLREQIAECFFSFQGFSRL